MKRLRMFGIAVAVALLGATGAVSAARRQVPVTDRSAQAVSQMTQPADSLACQATGRQSDVGGRAGVQGRRMPAGRLDPSVRHLRWQDDARSGTFSAFIDELEQSLSGLFGGTMGGAAMGGMGGGMMGGLARALIGPAARGMGGGMGGSMSGGMARGTGGAMARGRAPRQAVSTGRSASRTHGADSACPPPAGR